MCVHYGSAARVVGALHSGVVDVMGREQYGGLAGASLDASPAPCANVAAKVH
jgi:hypothetical protein